ncbi:MAG: hypothetical protein KGY76_07415 [Candidatus Thermoplasmatota archaeon]|nr:hypothetical protein [Candidatus Thermoplasmatota archaeon]
MSEVGCSLKLEYEDEETARMIAESIEPDNEGYLDLQVKGSELLCETEGEDPLQVLHTVDDLLMCVNIAEETSRVE